MQSDYQLSQFLVFSSSVCPKIVATVVLHELKNKLISPGYIEGKGKKIV